jgi:monoamine oxidase
MSVIFSSTSGFSSEKSTKIVVVGGGIAGLTTAYRLQKGGMDVDLYEARGRIGGRIFTARVNGRIAELGAQNIKDGGDSVNLNRLIDEFGLECVSSRVFLKHSYFDGSNLTPVREILRSKKIDPKILRDHLDKLALTCHNMKEILEEIVAPEDPLYKILAVRMAAYEGGAIEKLSPLYTDTLFHMLLGGICSVHQGNAEAESFVDLITVKGGNARLCQKIGEALGSKLHLNMPLAKVAKSQDGFQLTFQNGEEVKADIVVLSMPCSVYQQINFESDVIPIQKLEAIQNIQYGANAKIMVPFADLPVTTSGLVGDEVVAFFDILQQILTVYYTGKTSLFSPETITSSYSQVRPMIEKGFAEDCPPFAAPHYAKDEADLSYEGPVGYSWPNDPYSRGTYSYIADGQENVLTATVKENNETFKALFAPIDQKVYFAGEHASILSDVPGTMESACESGERIARVILQTYK